MCVSTRNRLWERQGTRRDNLVPPSMTCIETFRNLQKHSWEAMWFFNFDHVEFHQFLKRLERLWKAITCFHFVQDLNTSERSEIKSWKPCLLCKVIHQRLKSCLFLDQISGDTSDMNEAVRMLRLLCLLLLCGERAARPAQLCKAWLIKAEGRKKNMKNYPKQSNSKENRINIHQFHVISYESHQSVQIFKERLVRAEIFPACSRTVRPCKQSSQSQYHASVEDHWSNLPSTGPEMHPSCHQQNLIWNSENVWNILKNVMY